MRLNLLILSFIINNCCNAQQNNQAYFIDTLTSLQKENLKGRVKMVNTVMQKLTEVNGNLIKHTRQHSSSDYYNKAGFISRSIVDNTSYIFTYDDANRLVQQKITGGGGISKYTYNNLGQQVYADHSKSKAHACQTTLISYNKDTMRAYIINKNGRQMLSKFVIANINNQTLTDTSYYMGKPVNTTTYTYKNGLCHTRQQQSLSITFYYDSSSNIIKEERKPINSSTIFIGTYEYLFDKQGNWIMQTSYENGKAVYVTEREITYYN